MSPSPTNDPALADEIAAQLVSARRQGAALPCFPGRLPTDLAQAYAIQRAAIERWPEAIAGWKVGRLTPRLASQFGVERFVGPIFDSGVREALAGQACDFRMFPDGSAAFEAELIVYASQDQPKGQERFTAGDVGRLSGDLRLGIEVAGSPLASLPDLDSLASIAEFGNNNGLLIGPQVPLQVLDDPDSLHCSTWIDGAVAGSGGLSSLPGGGVGAFAFALEALNALGMPLKAGQFISTGAMTGVHPVKIGQRCTADIGRWGRVDTLVVAFQPAFSTLPASGAAPCP
jgi:2-keto-4-pentenoate hydratase